MSALVVPLLTTPLGAFLIYAGSRHQRLRRATPVAWLAPLGWIVLALSFIGLLGGFDVPAAIFAWIVLVMLPWSVIPLVLALRDHCRGSAG